jgi:hypothetical protein
MYPLIYRLFSIATTLPLSTAEDERVVSQEKLNKTSHRSSIKTFVGKQKRREMKVNLCDLS